MLANKSPLFLRNQHFGRASTRPLASLFLVLAALGCTAGIQRKVDAGFAAADKKGYISADRSHYGLAAEDPAAIQKRIDALRAQIPEDLRDLITRMNHEYSPAAGQQSVRLDEVQRLGLQLASEYVRLEYALEDESEKFQAARQASSIVKNVTAWPHPTFSPQSTEAFEQMELRLGGSAEQRYKTYFYLVDLSSRGFWSPLFQMLPVPATQDAYASLLPLVQVDKSCRDARMLPDETASERKSKTDLLKMADARLRELAAREGKLGELAGNRTLCSDDDVIVASVVDQARALELEAYSPPDRKRWGIDEESTASPEKLRAKVKSLEAALPEGLASLVPLPTGAEFWERFARRKDDDVALILSRMADLYLDIEQAESERNAKLTAAHAAVYALDKYVSFARNDEHVRPARVLFLGAEAAMRLGDLERAFSLVTLAMGDPKWKGYASLLGGDVSCAKGGEQNINLANHWYSIALSVGGPAMQIARERKVCGSNLPLGRFAGSEAPAAETWATQTGITGWPDISVPLKGAPPRDNDAALIVGIENYMAVPGVPGAKKNATDWYRHLTQTLGVPGDRVILLRDQEATVESMKKQGKRAASLVRPGGTLWFIFIGHGAPARDGQDGVLVAFDAQQDPDTLYNRSITQKEILAVLRSGKQAATVALLDACFSGRSGSGTALAAGLQPLLPVAQGKAQKAIIMGGGMTVFSAGKASEFAGPLPGLNRPAFSYLMLGALRGWGDENGDKNVTTREALDYTQRVLSAVVRGRDQTPQVITANESSLLSQGLTEKAPDITEIVAGM